MTTNYVLLEKITVGAAGAASVTFANIPQTGYTDLVLKASVRTNVSAIWDDVTLVFNSVSTGYVNNFVQGTGAAAGSGGASPASIVATVNGNTAASGTYGTFETYIPNYTSSNNKSYLTDSVTEANGTTSFAMMWAQRWENTASITSLTLSVVNGTLFLQNTTFYIYGVAKLNITPTVAPKASGGDIIDTDGTYWYHTFISSGTFTPATGLSCDCLVVAGGGGGGGAVNGSIGGGGGAGGYQYFTSQSVAAVGYSITVGAGGTGGSSAPGSGSNGSNSVFGALAASVGGGAGGAGHGLQAGSSGANGGSGGGAGFSATTTTTGGTGTAGQGNNGGPEGSGGGGAGGGGAGGAATTGSAGVGLANSITGSSITYAIGGAGLGAAGNGITPSNPIPNRGIGGDAGWNAAGGNGGSGVVIIRYLVA
jgi:hypothetical protein